MKNKKVSDLVLYNIYLLIPLILYAVFKNGYLIYAKKLIGIIDIFKPIYLVLISVLIKFIIDLIKSIKIKIDYNLVYVILISMIVPYNINILIYTITFTISYIISLLIEKLFKFNKVCFIYLILIVVLYITNNLDFRNPLEINYTYTFSFIDLFTGRLIGGISSTNILLSLIAFSILIVNYYYKKNIPIAINITYILLAIIYYIVFKDSSFLLNSEVIFGSIFISTLPEYSPFNEKNQILYGIIIGILTFILSIFFNSIISIYIVIFILSIFLNIKSK